MKKITLGINTFTYVIMMVLSVTGLVCVINMINKIDTGMVNSGNWYLVVILNVAAVVLFIVGIVFLLMVFGDAGDEIKDYRKYQHKE